MIRLEIAMTDQKTIDYYNLNANSYGDVPPDPNGQFVSYRHSFMKMMSSGGRVLDLGCGGGHAALAFLENGFEVVALDGSVEIARVAANRTKIDVVVKDFTKLDFHSEFDGIWAAASLTHVALDKLDDVLEKVCNSLRPDGVLVASFKCSEEDWRDSEGRFYSGITPEVLSQMAVKSGLKVNSIDVVQGKGRLLDPTTWAWLTASRMRID